MRMQGLPVVPALLLVLIGPAVLCQKPVEEREAFSVLQHRTAWVFLGLVSVETGRLAVDVDGHAYDFTIVGREPGSTGGTIPKIGDRIRAISAWRMTILDYGTSGEKNRLLSPTTREQLFPSDETNLVVREGSVVEVRDVQLSRALGPSRMLWARVTPDPK
jgi:hypothetical protein